MCSKVPFSVQQLPQIFANQFLDEYKSRNLPVPNYLKKLVSSRRTIQGNSMNKVVKGFASSVAIRNYSSIQF
jgi:hypothetical protein